MNGYPPIWPFKFLKWFCPAHLFEEIEGDIIQKFEKDVNLYGERKAKRRLIWNVIRFFRPGIVLRNSPSARFNQWSMIKHLLKIFVRTSLKGRAYSIINISGLVVGLACSILIFLWVNDEISYDQFYPDKDRIYQVMENQNYSDGNIFTYEATPVPLTEVLKNELPEIEQVCRTSWNEYLLFQSEKQSFVEQGIYADSNFFNFFSFSILKGDPHHPLRDRNSVVISQKLATKYFKGNDPLGQTFKIDKKIDVKVVAVFQDVPENSTRQFDFVLPFSQMESDQITSLPGAKPKQDWSNNAILSHVKLERHASQTEVNNTIKGYLKKYHEGYDIDLFLFPLTEWRLQSNFENGHQVGGRITYVICFGIVALFILLIACVNFMNMATARAATRFREVGIRKVSGSSRGLIIQQFLLESLLLSFTSLVIALLSVHLLLPFFNYMTSKQVILDYTDPFISGGLVSIALLTGLAAGCYPAFFISSVKPIAMLNGNVHSALSGGRLRNLLVTFQFSISVVLIICALVIYDQLHYIRNKNLGFTKENILFFNTPSGIKKNFESFRNEALKSPLIRYVAQGTQTPTELNGSADADWNGKSEAESILFQASSVDFDYIPTMGMSIVEGRNFSRDMITDSSAFLINEEALKLMRFKNPIGQRIEYFEQKGDIIGVVKNFHNTNLHHAIQPMIFRLQQKDLWATFVRYEPGKVEEAVHYIEHVYAKFETDFPIEIGFVDKDFEAHYRSEILMGNLSIWFTAIAIFISCLGLFGLTIFTTERRTKEIGIRKILGATTTNLVVMLCNTFSRPIFAAIALALPVAYSLTNMYLKEFEFHAELNPWIFTTTAIGVIAMALLTISYQSLSAARKNPTDSLRIE